MSRSTTAWCERSFATSHMVPPPCRASRRASPSRKRLDRPTNPQAAARDRTDRQDVCCRRCPRSARQGRVASDYGREPPGRRDRPVAGRERTTAGGTEEGQEITPAVLSSSGSPCHQTYRHVMARMITTTTIIKLISVHKLLVRGWSWTRNRGSRNRSRHHCNLFGMAHLPRSSALPRASRCAVYAPARLNYPACTIQPVTNITTAERFWEGTAIASSYRQRCVGALTSMTTANVRHIQIKGAHEHEGALI